MAASGDTGVNLIVFKSGDGRYRMMLHFDDGDQYVSGSSFDTAESAMNVARVWANHYGMTIERMQ